MTSDCAICDAQALAALPGLDVSEARRVIVRYPVRIPAHFASLIKKSHDPLWLQAVPSICELSGEEKSDPLCEESQSPVPGLVHRYPDRVLFLVENRCALYCRHCMRKRRMGGKSGTSPEVLERGLAYIRNSHAVREVVLSGGDPFMMEEGALIELIARIYSIPHVKVVRIHTRVPCADPQRVTGSLAAGLSRFSPLFVNIQFNHPEEIAPEAADAARRLASARVQLGSQSVLLRGVNDDSKTLAALFTGLLGMGIRPYCLHHPDQVAGTGHFSVPLLKGLKLVESLRGRISGMAIPHYMLDLPGGFGKTALLPGSVETLGGGGYRVRDYRGTWRIYRDRLPPG